ncbi:septation ring formation regulator EzrA [Paenalkalicoccus suaedae]|uniref:Septation ring formation regulator EzrA n=1 Tax=Paenalkalicoccus suaedae TaxID=2592382 RepID=A0A859FIJ8_9BACI|nr:septation ring formation regulator EzrA [Paenalkalicoccus suaedae]QKS72066.1 septation ring formation regulator EzrA [Paenalkalicoccus suaedae]
MTVYVIIGVVVVLAALIGYGALSRKRIYQEVDRLGAVKMELMNKPVTEELSKMKGLKMSGETEARFEQWREEWDSIVTVQLPDMEEKLFNVEEYANKYRFSRAKQELELVDEQLLAISQHMEQLVKEVKELIHSEEKNRSDIGSMKELYDETKKKLWVQKGTLGPAVPALEQTLKDVQEKFTVFEEQTEEGNYYQARETLQEIETQLNQCQQIIEEVPHYLLKTQKEIPNQLSDLKAGMQEMAAEGYPMEHFSASWQVEEIEKRHEMLLPLIVNLQIEEVKEPVETIESDINDIYDKLEHEVLARKAVESERIDVATKMEQLPILLQDLETEMELVKANYRLTEEDDRKLIQITKELREIQAKFAVLDDVITERKQTFTTARKRMDEFKEELEAFTQELTQSKENFRHLRSDERNAEEAILHMKQEMTRGLRTLKRSNLPGIPETLVHTMDAAEDILQEVSEELKQTPISMQEVKRKLQIAEDEVEGAIGQLEDTIYFATMAERVIQYGNRYRSTHDHIHILLLQAEDRFRSYLYEEALELALEGVESKDPYVLDKVKDKDLVSQSNS